MTKLAMAIMFAGMIGFSGPPERPEPLTDVINFGPSSETYRWCLDDKNYENLIDRDWHLNFIINWYEEKRRV